MPGYANIVARIPAIRWPSTALASSGRYDALKFIDEGATRESVYPCIIYTTGNPYGHLVPCGGNRGPELR